METVFKDWVVDECIGEGAFGKVYRMHREDFGYVYTSALKVIHIPLSQTEYDSVCNDLSNEQEVHDYFYGMVEDIVAEFALMSKLKGKLEARYKENKALKLEFVPEPEEEEFEDELAIVRRKQVELDPMVAEEAVLQMEMLGHDFFVFLDMDTDAVSVVYKRKGGEYGLIETDR